MSRNVKIIHLLSKDPPVNDAYLPALSALVFSDDEKDAIAAALAKEKPWKEKNDFIKSAKKKIREHHLARHGKTCCYCRTVLHGGGDFMIDREHVLPKGTAVYKPFSYAIWNLSVSCKRCNLDLKKSDDCFVIDKTNVASFQVSSNYRIIHPNFDVWEHHLSRECRQSNQKVMVKYSRIGTNEKGQYTYDYFKLKNLEINTFDEGQGIERPAALNESPAALAVRAAAIEHGQ